MIYIIVGGISLMAISLIAVFTCGHILCSIIVVIALFVGLQKKLISSGLATAEHNEEGEAEEEEEDPESDDLAHEPLVAGLLHIAAKLSILRSVNHVDVGVDNKTKEGIGSGDVPDDGPVNSDKGYCQ